MRLFAIARLVPRTTVALLAGGVAVSCASLPNGGPASDAVREVGVGYGTQDRDEVTGAVGSVDAEDVRGQEFTRIEDMINGRIAGVRVERLPGGGLTLRVRGTSTIMASREPLLVIDGLPIHGAVGPALLALNPSEIERIDVLKDAGSTAIYGGHGANGVVLITTKRSR